MAYSLVLGGGGARGVYHIGLLKALQEKNIKIKEISGTSIGAILGLLYASDPDFDFDKVFNDFDFMKFIRFTYSLSGFLSPEKIENFLKRHVPQRDFSELKIKLSFNAVDINTGEEVVFSEGKIFPAVIASMAVPGVFPLVNMEDRLLCDAGVINSLPVSLIKSRNKKIISDIRPPLKKITKNSSRYDILSNYLVIPQMSTKIEEDSLYMRYKGDLGMFDFRKQKLLPLLDEGYREATTLLSGK
ncbi:MAG: patatin-like phospholipase family protein [Nanobdellota archaeon]